MEQKTVIFMGTAEFSASVLQKLIDQEDLKIMAVVTQPDRLVGRKKELSIPAAKQLAQANGIEVFQPDRLSKSEDMQTLIDMHADFLITAAYGQLLPEKFLESAKIAAINVHASLLPAYRGAAPINWSIIKGDAKTGVTIMYMVKAMDAGNIISTVEVPIEDKDTSKDLFEKLAVVGSQLLVDTLPKLVSGEADSIVQDESKVTFAPKITNELLPIDFEQQTATNIVNLIRGLPEDKKPYFNIKGQKISVIQAKDITGVSSTQENDSNLPAAGTVLEINKNQLLMVSAQNTVLSIEKLQLPGKNEIAIRDFYNGFGRSLKSNDVVDKL